MSAYFNYSLKISMTIVSIFSHNRKDEADFQKKIKYFYLIVDLYYTIES